MKRPPSWQFFLKLLLIFALSYAHGVVAFVLVFWGVSFFLWPIFPFVNWLETQNIIHPSNAMFTPMLILNGLMWVLPVWILGTVMWRHFGKCVNH